MIALNLSWFGRRRPVRLAGENSRVLGWIFRRSEGHANAVDIETVIGLLPPVREGGIDIDGLDVSPQTMARLLHVDINGWTQQLPQMHEHYAKFGAKLPRELLAQLDILWLQRIRAVLYHHGVAGAPEHLDTLAGRQFLAKQKLPVDASERIHLALEMIDLLEIQLATLERPLRALARRQTGCKALMRQYGMGELTSLVTLGELGDVAWLTASRQAVRMAGLEIGVHRSDREAILGKLTRRKLTRQGSAELRWALYDAAQSACRPASPDYHDYLALKARGLSHTRASPRLLSTDAIIRDPSVGGGAEDSVVERRGRSSPVAARSSWLLASAEAGSPLRVEWVSARHW